MKNLLKQTVKATIGPMYHALVDRYSFSMKTPLYRQLYYSIRFRLAGKGIFLTENERKFASYKDKHKGKRCFIIGNGPSLNKLDLTLLKNEFTIGVNAIYLNYEKMHFHPTYYVIEDYLVAEDREKEINQYTAPKAKFFGAYLEYTLKKSGNTMYTNVICNYPDEKNFPLFSLNPSRYLGVGGSVTYICLQLAYFMGFDEVYLIGFDHSYKLPKNIDVTKSEVITSEHDDQNHFSPDYFGKGYRWHDPKVDRMEVGFRKAREVYEQNGRRVYNATVGGHLEVFERVDFNKLFYSNVLTQL